MATRSSTPSWSGVGAAACAAPLSVLVYLAGLGLFWTLVSFIVFALAASAVISDWAKMRTRRHVTSLVAEGRADEARSLMESADRVIKSDVLSQHVLRFPEAAMPNSGTPSPVILPFSLPTLCCVPALAVGVACDAASMSWLWVMFWAITTLGGSIWAAMQVQRHLLVSFMRAVSKNCSESAVRSRLAWIEETFTSALAVWVEERI